MWNEISFAAPLTASPYLTLPELKSKPPAGITRMDLTEKNPLGTMLNHPLKADKIRTKAQKTFQDSRPELSLVFHQPGMGRICQNPVKIPKKLGSVKIQLVFHHHQGTPKILGEEV